jgi:NADH-quinone oxidoreductase subunit J
VSAQEIVFILVGLGTAASAVLTVTSRNLVHAALFLAGTLAGIGGVFLVLRADFVAWTQIIVYVGAIAVLFLFGLMLTRAPIGREALDSQNRGLGLVVAASMFVLLTTLIVSAFGDLAPSELAGPGITEIGLAIFSTWVFPFELASMLLLGALIGAILLSRRETGESGTEQDLTQMEIGAPPSLELGPGGEDTSRELETTGGGQA